MQRNKEKGQGRQKPKWKIKAENVTERKHVITKFFKKTMEGDGKRLKKFVTKDLM